MKNISRVLILAPCFLFLSGCARGLVTLPVTTPTSPFDVSAVLYLEDVPPITQQAYQCGPAALASVLNYWKDPQTAEAVATALYKPGSHGVLNFELLHHAGERGFWAQVPSGADESPRPWLERKIPLVAMLSTGVLWAEKYHFVVLKGFNDNERFYYANTGDEDTRAIDYGEFENRWNKAGRWSLVVCPPERVDWPLDTANAARLAILLEKRGRPDLAERRYREAGNDPGARFNLANLYLNVGRLPEAEAIYRELLAAEPAWTAAGNNLAWIRHLEGRHEEAALILEESLRKDPSRPYDILDTAGVVFCRLG